MLVGTGPVQNLTYQTQDIDCCNHDGGAGYNGQCAVEYIIVLERSDKDGHLGNKTAQSRQTEIGKAGNDITYTQERHDLH